MIPINNTIKRFICVLLCIIFTVSCSKNQNNNKTTNNNVDTIVENNVVDLAFCANDTLNPFTAITKENQEITTLLFDPLVHVDENFEIEYKLASKITCDGTTCIVELKDVMCSNGIKLTAEDVVYTLKLILSNENAPYSDQLSNIYSYNASSPNKVELFLETYDPYFYKNLDFPIIQQNSDQLKDDNNRLLPPVGCGKYLFSNQDNGYSLIENEYYYDEIKCKTINLVDCPDTESLNHAASTNKIDYLYSNMSDNYLPNFSGNKINVNINQMVYLGINSDNNYLGNSQFRHIINCAIDRNKIVQDAYFGYAQYATGLFNPNWKVLEHFKCFNNTADTQKCIAYFEQLGYNNKDSNDYYLSPNGKRIKFRLLYNTDNSMRSNVATLIYRQLIKCGVEVDLIGVKYNKYVDMLKNGEYDLYIGEVKILQSMSLYDIFNNGDIIYGIDENCNTKKSFLDYYDGNGDFGLAINNFNDELPFIPLCYRYGVAICSTKYSTGSLQPTSNYVYNGIENIAVSK